MKIKIFIILFSLSSLGFAQSLVKQYFSPQEATQANTARSVEYLTLGEKKFLLYINLCRQNPKQFAAFYVAYLKENDKWGYSQLKKKDKYYYSLLKELKNQKPLRPFSPDKKMYDLALCWAKESGKKGLVGHNRKKCRKGYAAECCSYSSSDSPLNFVFNLLVDEKVPSLGHRKALLGNYKKAGVAIQKHKKYGWCLVTDLSY